MNDEHHRYYPFDLLGVVMALLHNAIAELINELAASLAWGSALLGLP